MGAFASCCGRRKRKYEPLNASDEDENVNPQSPETKQLAAAAGALSAGKLPSEEQGERILRAILNSDMLKYPSDFGGQGPLSTEGKQILMHTREVIEALLQIGMEKNQDDTVQDLLFSYSKLNKSSAKLHVDLQSTTVDNSTLNEVVDSIPTSEEIRSDATTAVKSVRSLASLLLTSSAFRLILSDMFTTSREILADVLGRIGSVAATVETQAQKTEAFLRPDPDQQHTTEIEETRRKVNGNVATVGEETQEHWNQLASDAPDRIRESFLQRWTEILERAQSDPSYRASALTLLSLMQKYYGKFYGAATIVNSQEDVQLPAIVVATDVNVDQNLATCMKDLRTILERFAGHQSLESLFTDLDNALRHLGEAPDQVGIRLWMEDAGAYLQKALDVTGWATSDDGYSEAAALYDRGQQQLHSEGNAVWINDFKALSIDVDNVLSSISSDRATQRLLQAAEALANDLRNNLKTVLGIRSNIQNQIYRELKRDFFSWLLPRLLRLIRAVPLPRVEFTSPSLDAAIDSLIVSSLTSSFTPDRIHVQSAEEFEVTFDNLPTGELVASTQGYARTKIHVDGVRLNAHGISYYLNYKGPWRILGWEDAGLLDVDAGRQGHSGDGVEIDIDLDTNTSDINDSFFRVLAVKLDIPGLRFGIRKSRHWLINKLLLQPLMGPVVRRVIGTVMEEQIKVGLSGLDNQLAAIDRRARKGIRIDDTPSWDDYWEALLEHFSSNSLGDEPPVEVQEVPVSVVHETTATTRGIIYKTTTQDHPEDAQPSSPVETAIAIGAGEQLLPGKGGPALVQESPATVARETAEELQNTLESGLYRAQNVSKKGMESAATVNTTRRRQARMERSYPGWYSEVFDIR